MGGLTNPGVTTVEVAALIATHAALLATHGQTALAGVKSGTYTGNDAANRAMPHGLGVTPKVVLFQELSNAYMTSLIQGTGAIYTQDITVGVGLVRTVTIPDATNFYVGDGTNHTQTANSSARSYLWIAIG